MYNTTYNRTSFLFLLEQSFVTDQPAKDVLHEDRYWKRFVPHEKSGPCETYDPPSESDPGYEISMYCFFYKDVAFLCLQHCVVKSIDNK